MNKILIVEDEEFLVRALKDNLEVESCTVDTAADGDEAIERIKKQRPDIILLDLLMPKRDGFYVLEEVKKNPEWKLIPVIVLSNLGGDAEIKRALELGADDYFVKSQHPIEEVIEKVKEHLEGRKRARAAPLEVQQAHASATSQAPLPVLETKEPNAAVRTGSIPEELITYIREARKSGLDDGAIRKNLQKAGWQEVDVTNALAPL